MDKRFDFIEARLLEMAERQEAQEKLINQRLGNLPVDLHRVRERIDATTNEQRNTALSIEQLRSEVRITGKHVGHVHDLVDNMRDKSLNSRQLVQDKIDLVAQLQDARSEHRTSHSQLVDFENRLQKMQRQQEQLLEEIERLRSENAGLRLDKHSREVLDQFRSEQLNPNNPQPYEFKALLESDYRIKKKR